MSSVSQLSGTIRGALTFVAAEVPTDLVAGLAGLFAVGAGVNLATDFLGVGFWVGFFSTTFMTAADDAKRPFADVLRLPKSDFRSPRTGWVSLVSGEAASGATESESEGNGFKIASRVDVIDKGLRTPDVRSTTPNGAPHNPLAEPK
jgi:hypothetical protein